MINSSVIKDIFKVALEYSYCVEQRENDVNYPIKINNDLNDSIKENVDFLHSFQNADEQTLNDMYNDYVEKCMKEYNNSVILKNKQLQNIKQKLKDLYTINKSDDETINGIINQVKQKYENQQKELETYIENNQINIETCLSFADWFKNEQHIKSIVIDRKIQQYQNRNKIVKKQNDWVDKLFNHLGLDYDQYIQEQQNNQ